jgi:hypothetical protein
MDYLTAWKEGHEAGMSLAYQLINDFTGQDFKTASEVVLYIKELEKDRELSYFGKTTEVISNKEEKMMDALAEKIAMSNWMWKD